MQFDGSTFGYVTQWYNGAYTQSTATAIPVVDNQTATANAALALGGMITGTVTDSVTHAPVPASITAYDSATGDVVVSTYSSGIPGAPYTLKGVRAGVAYKVGFSAYNYTSQYYNNKATLALADPVTVASVSVPLTGIDAALVPQTQPTGGGITGSVLGPCGPATALVSVINGTTTVASGVAFNGAYTINGIPSGTYTVAFSDMSGVLMGTTTSAVVVTAPSVTTVPPVTMTMGGSISGRITDSTGAGVSDAYVTATDASNRQVGSATAPTSRESSQETARHPRAAELSRRSSESRRTRT